MKQGLVVSNFQRVYVRYTGEELYYYSSQEADTPIGALDLEGLVVKFDNKKSMLRWCDVKRGRSANFCALNSAQFKEWKAAVVGKGAEINSSTAITEQALISGAASLTVVVHSGRDLTPMDVNGKSDPYCIIGLCTTTGEWLQGAKRKKTPVIRKTLHPHWKKGNKCAAPSWPCSVSQLTLVGSRWLPRTHPTESASTCGTKTASRRTTSWALCSLPSRSSFPQSR